jgi:hypothetical protein
MPADKQLQLAWLASSPFLSLFESHFIRAFSPPNSIRRNQLFPFSPVKPFLEKL